MDRLLHSFRGLCAIAVVGWTGSLGLAADSPAELAKAAAAVLKERCYSCHGESGANEGGFNYALNRKRLVRELVVPGSTDESKLFQRVVKGEMPPDGDKLPKDEIETLRKWIEADAPSFGAEAKRAFVSPVDMLAVMLKDLEQAHDRDRPFYRYFTLTHLYNAGFEDNELESHRQGLSKLVNSLSWGRVVQVPKPIDATKTILRIDLRHYKWNENEAWSQIIAADPYRVTYSDKSAQSCYTMTKCELPHVRADWFVFSASRPPLYNKILGLPETPEQMLAFETTRLGVDVTKNLADYNDVMRAGFYPSGVSKSIRLIERHVSSYGAYWKSYDFKPVDPKENPPRRRNLKAFPTGPGGKNGFEHDGGEMIFSLPNGLQAYMLTDAAGKQIPKGPTDVVVDKEAVKRGRDPEVVNGVSCMNCHWSGMLNKTDQIRDHVLSQPKAYTKEVFEFVTAVYVPKAELNAKLKEDRDRFEAAVKRCGLTGLAKSEPVATLAFQFDEPLDLDLAAAEAGVTPDKLVSALRTNSALGRELGSLPQGQPVPRDTYVQQFGPLVKELKVGTFLALLSIGGNTVPTIPTRPNTTSPAASTAKEYTSKSTGMKLALIPAGEFEMGSKLSAPELVAKFGQTEAYFADEFPLHRVKLSQPYYMGRHEVTVGQFRKFVTDDGYQTEAETDGKGGFGFDEAKGTFVQDAKYTWRNAGFSQTDGHPVVNVTWNDAQKFCAWLSRKDGGTTYRLPTEAEWEYAAKAGTTTLYPSGDDPESVAKIGNIADGTAKAKLNFKDAISAKDGYVFTAPVGSFTANKFGLYDVTGNVWEWCEDVYDARVYASRSGVTSNPKVTSGSEDRVLRGGSWYLKSCTTRSASRLRFTPVDRGANSGFRVVISAAAVRTP